MKRVSVLLSLDALFFASRSFDVVCPTGPFCCAWVSIVFLHATHGAILLRAVYSQIWTLISPEEVEANLRLTGERFRPALFFLAIAMEVVFSAYHVVVIVQLARHSIRARMLSLVDPDGTCKSGATLLSRSLQAITTALSSTFSRSSTAVRRWTHLCGIRGPYFERAFHAKELYEVFWESFQLYRCMYWVVHPAIGDLALGVLVLNCWTTPLIYIWFPHTSHRATRFVLCLVVDAMLDFTSSILIPYVVFLHYRMLLASPQSFDAGWAFTVGTDLVQFTPTDLTGILARLLPSISMVMNLAAIKSLIKRGRNEDARVGPTVRILPPPADACVPATGAPLTVTSIPSRQPRWIRTLHTFLFALGVAGVVLVTVRNRDADVEGLPHCKVVMRHWLVSRVPCAVLEVHCVAEDSAGDTVTAVSSILDKVDRKALHTLTFINCASLVMPDTIRRFPNLNWLEIRNSTLTSWPQSAALTKSTSPRFGRLLFVGVDFVEFPQALYGDASVFPPTLRDITFSKTNLTDLPPDLHKAWPQPMASLRFERGHLTSVPSTLLAMQTDILSLAGNSISAIPPAFFNGKTFTALSLSNNPIHELPPKLLAPFKMRKILTNSDPQDVWLVNTRISSLPDWIKFPSSSGAIYAESSPICTLQASPQNGEETARPSALRCAIPVRLPSGISPEGFFSVFSDGDDVARPS